jgi:uncharacterized protein (DUF58 family)
MREGIHFLDPAQAAKIKDLQLLARTVVEGLSGGMHRSPHAGTSIEFAQYRPYCQGDDPRHVDWRLYARTDRLHVKQYQDETNLRCTILLDCSASMDYGSGEITKFEYARMLAACIAMILAPQRDQTGLIAYHHELETYIPPRVDAKHLQRILVELQNLKPAGKTDAEKALRYLGDVIHPRGMVVLISDLLHPVDGMTDHLRSLSVRGHDLIVLQISDPAEQTFPFDRVATLVDAEGMGEQYTVPDLVRDEYLENRKRHFDHIRTECHASEIDIAEFTSTEPLDRALHFFIQQRNHALQGSSLRQRKQVGGRA